MIHFHDLLQRLYRTTETIDNLGFDEGWRSQREEAFQNSDTSCWQTTISGEIVAFDRTRPTFLRE